MAHRIAEPPVVRKPLRVLHRGLAMVPDYRSMADANGNVLPNGTRRHIGLTFDTTAGPEDDFHNPRTGETQRGHHGGFVIRRDAPEEIAADSPHYGEFVRHLKDGDLWAADQDTADAAGILFEPEFGGEHPEVRASAECAKVIADRKAKVERMTAEAKAIEAQQKTATPPDGTRVPSEMGK